jgi:Asp/Glu/hydantoin racemase
MAHRVALIHAGPVSVEPVAKAFAEIWPEAECANITDDSLMVDRAKEHELTAALALRIERLAAYARDLGADGVLFTCSAFGPAIEAVQRKATWPVLKPNEAMFEAALQHGRRIGMVASFQNSIPQMEQEFRDLVAGRGNTATIQSICVPAALAALQAGDVAGHNRLLAEGAARLGDCDAILLAQFSTSRAAALVREVVKVPVLTAPGTAVAKMKRLLLPAG